VLGDLMEKSLRRGLVLSDGDLTPFFTRPIAGSIFALIAIILLMRAPFIKKLFKRQSP
jgi:putative tricarboxylic transport membrane protein